MSHVCEQVIRDVIMDPMGGKCTSVCELKVYYGCVLCVSLIKFIVEKNHDMVHKGKN